MRKKRKKSLLFARMGWKAPRVRDGRIVQGGGLVQSQKSSVVEMCELSELSELSPGGDCISAETGRSFGLRAAYSERPVCHPALV